MNCALGDKGLLAPDYSNPPMPFSGPDTRDPEDYFDPSLPLPTDSNC